VAITITKRSGLCAELLSLREYISDGGKTWIPAYSLLEESLKAWGKVRTGADGRTLSLAGINGFSEIDLRRVLAEIVASHEDMSKRDDRPSAAAHLDRALTLAEAASLKQN
jgi:hypothetical protein